MDIVRHAVFMLGNNEEESLKNCDAYDQAQDKWQVLMQALLDCKDQSKIDYAKRVLENFRKKEKKESAGKDGE